MDIRLKMREGFRDLQGGLFGKVEKADVGGAAEEVQRAGGDMLGWADPFMPDDCMPAAVKAIAIDRIEKGLSAHYTHPVGDAELKAAIARKLARQNGLSVVPERNILITPGSDSGLLFAMMPFIEPGDEVLVPDPSYPSNFLNPKLLGGRAVSVLLDEANGFRLTRAALEAALSPRTKMVLLTNPNNPTTTVFSREEMTMLAEFVIEHDLVTVVDQAFEDFLFDGREMVTLAARHVGEDRHGLLRVQGHGPERRARGIPRRGRPHHGRALRLRGQRHRRDEFDIPGGRGLRHGPPRVHDRGVLSDL